MVDNLCAYCAMGLNNAIWGRELGKPLGELGRRDGGVEGKEGVAEVGEGELPQGNVGSLSEMDWGTANGSGADFDFGKELWGYE